MRHTIEDARYYLSLVNTLTSDKYDIYCANGKYTLVKCVSHGGMSDVSSSIGAGEMYRLLDTLYNVLYNEKER